MTRRRMPISAVVARGKSHLTKEEIEARQQAEDAVKPRSDNIVCPTWLDATAKKMWNEIADELSVLDLMTNVDVYALAIACDAYSKYATATKTLKKEGLISANGSFATGKANPNVAIAQKYSSLFRSFCAEFGLSPSARARLARPKDDEDEDEDDDLD